VKRVYDVYQYIFSGEGEHVVDMHHIFSQQGGLPGSRSFTHSVMRLSCPWGRDPWGSFPDYNAPLLPGEFFLDTSLKRIRV
jgi:hypothetical protein